MNGRTLLVLVVVVALLGAGYWKRDALLERYRQWQAGKSGSTAPDAATSSMPSSGSSELRTTSRLPPPDAPNAPTKAPPGTFYITKYKRITSPEGIKTLQPGDHVRLVERYNDGRLLVTVDRFDFTVAANEVTEDVATARAAEQAFLRQPITR